ncbi:YolD-like family protein [Paenibacillus sp. 2RAB27]|uniref:YolD-like family protein n=1 Tax=Paenibacillus sp. 2RAB27 TaxID=3232991 RepID=UPI003F9E3CC8
MSKINNNGIWESSRFIGPEFKDAIRLQQKEIKRISKPILDEQEVYEISASLSQSQMYKKTILITLFNEYQPRMITGIVTRSKQSEFRIDSVDPFNGVEDWQWICYKDVLKAELSKEWTEDEMVDP